jgi:hypothetical protein
MTTQKHKSLVSYLKWSQPTKSIVTSSHQQDYAKAVAKRVAAQGRRPSVDGLTQLDEEQREEALELIERYQTPGISKRKACVRAARDIKRKYKIAVSTVALLNLVRKSQFV